MKEIYEVEQVEYEEGLPPEIPPCCKLQVRKEDDQTQNKTLSSTNIFKGRGDFSAVNFQSLNNSVNIQDRPETVFDEARQRLHAAIGDQVLLKELLAHLRLMEDARSQPKWAAAYSKFIEDVANHMTVIAPLWPALAETVKNAI
jgi:hypothetical protein